MSARPQLLNYVKENNPIQRIREDILSRLIAAQRNTIDHAFKNAADFYAKIFDDLKLSLAVPRELKDKSAQAVSDLPFSELKKSFFPVLENGGIPGQTARIHAMNLAQRAHLIRAFEDPEKVLSRVIVKVSKIIESFPRTASDIEKGRNPGDVLDPYILSATQTLLYAGDFKSAIGRPSPIKLL